MCQNLCWAINFIDLLVDCLMSHQLAVYLVFYDLIITQEFFIQSIFPQLFYSNPICIINQFSILFLHFNIIKLTQILKNAFYNLIILNLSFFYMLPIEDQFHKKHILDVKQGFLYSFNTLSHSPTYNYSQQSTRRQFVLDCTNKQKSKMNVYNPLYDKFLQYRVIQFKNLNNFREKLEHSDKENKMRNVYTRGSTFQLKKSKNLDGGQKSPLTNDKNLQHVYGKQMQKKQFDDFIQKKKQIIQKKLAGVANINKLENLCSAAQTRQQNQTNNKFVNKNQSQIDYQSSKMSVQSPFATLKENIQDQGYICQAQKQKHKYKQLQANLIFKQQGKDDKNYAQDQ